MIVIQAQNLGVSFGEREILKNVNLAINEKERIGLLGVNGSGKTTLLKCLTGKLIPDQGQISLDNSCSLACLEQLPDLADNLTAWDIVMGSFADLLEMRRTLRGLEIEISQAGLGINKLMEQYAGLQEKYDRAEGYSCENTARRILKGLGFGDEQFTQPWNSFSGGQKTRINLGRLLAKAPDLLLLDEPTNHLDIAALEWLENYLGNYKGTILVVSHDRMFLDKLASRVVELRDGLLYSYPGNYSNYLKQKAQNDLAWQRAYEKQQEHIQNTEAYISRYKAGIKSKQAKGRQSQLERLERIKQPLKEKNIANWSFAMEQETGQDVLQVRDLSKSYGNRLLLNKISLHIKKGDKIALVGPNGSGKTTLLKIITGLIPADEGEVKPGSRVETGYFSQEYEDLNPNNTLLEELINNYDIKVEEARSILGRMLFRGDDVFKQVGILSGGEKGRLSLLKLILTRANFLILDEPSNHLDIESRQAVEDMLSAYPGTILLVSHDRYLINQLVNGILSVENQKLQYYWGNYDYFYTRLMENQSNNDEENNIDTELKLQKIKRFAQKEKQKLEKRRDKQLTIIENQISELENRKKELEDILSMPASYDDQIQLKNYNLEYDKIENCLEVAMEEWETLCNQIEESN
ncbi:MAG: ABC-F type ribosomal protection protein [Syntrophomonadaceae bacterium]|nr:ABC-F type ribosomal protection protein [Syntrophomonadaceae bacterium]MDD3023394.1 ABC-F type ribosomal protection protein [Syntrophomonadaceae bacterium]